MNELIIIKDNKPIIPSKVVGKIIQLYTLKAELEMIEKELKEQAKEYIEQHDGKPIIVDGLAITYKKATTRKSVDTDKLKADGKYEIYLKEIPVKASVSISVDL